MGALRVARQSSTRQAITCGKDWRSGRKKQKGRSRRSGTNQVSPSLRTVAWRSVAVVTHHRLVIVGTSIMNRNEGRRRRTVGTSDAARRLWYVKGRNELNNEAIRQNAPRDCVAYISSHWYRNDMIVWLVVEFITWHTSQRVRSRNRARWALLYHWVACTPKPVSIAHVLGRLISIWVLAIHFVTTHNGRTNVVICCENNGTNEKKRNGMHRCAFRCVEYRCVCIQ